jgi:hypothetical protein
MAADPSPAERREWREALLTYGPAILLAFVLDWALATYGGWAPRRALLTSIGVGIAAALVLQWLLNRRGRAE